MKRLIIGLMTVAAWLVGIAIAALLGLYLLAKAGTVDAHYRCPGEMESLGNPPEKSTAFLRIQTYSPFLFWAKDSGMLWVETNPQGDFLLLQNMRINNDVMVSFADDGVSVDMSKNSLVVRMGLSADRYFVGECSQAPR